MTFKFYAMIFTGMALTGTACGGNSLPTSPTDSSAKYGDYELRVISGTAWAPGWNGYEIKSSEFGKGVLVAQIAYSPVVSPTPLSVNLVLAIMEERPGSAKCDEIIMAKEGPKCLVILVRNDSLDNPKTVDMETNGLDVSKYVHFRPNVDMTLNGVIRFRGMRK